jgi:hypothetical protein
LHVEKTLNLQDLRRIPHRLFKQKILKKIIT